MEKSIEYFKLMGFGMWRRQWKQYTMKNFWCFTISIEVH